MKKKKIGHLDDDTAISIPVSVVLNSMTSLVVITSLLKELKMLNSELGHLATSMTIVSHLFGWSASMILMGIRDSQNNLTAIQPLYIFLVVIGYYCIVIFLVRPLTIRIVSKTSDGESKNQNHFKK